MTESRPESLPGVNVTLLTLADDVLVALAQAARGAALGALTADAVHDVNNALFGMLGQAELLSTDPALDAAAAERLRLIVEAGDELKPMLRRLGVLARGDARLGPVELDAEVREALALPRLDQIHARFPAEPLQVVGDSATVAQIVLHLLLHALAAGGSPELELRRDGDSAVLLVRAGGAAEPRDGGLGLAVAGALARSLGGSLDAPEPQALRLSLPLV